MLCSCRARGVVSRSLTFACDHIASSLYVCDRALCVRGRGRHGYEVKARGGGIGAGFPSVTLRSMVSPGAYLH